MIITSNDIALKTENENEIADLLYKLSLLDMRSNMFGEILYSVIKYHNYLLATEQPTCEWKDEMRMVRGEYVFYATELHIIADKANKIQNRLTLLRK